jgi:hypothetical protein
MEIPQVPDSKPLREELFKEVESVLQEKGDFLMDDCIELIIESVICKIDEEFFHLYCD